MKGFEVFRLHGCVGWNVSYQLAFINQDPDTVHDRDYRCERDALGHIEALYGLVSELDL